MVSLINNPVLLVDADTILYRCGFAAEKVHYLVTSNTRALGPEIYAIEKNAQDAKKALGELKEDGAIWSRREVEPLENALGNVTKVVRALEDRYKPSLMHMYLTGKGNFRDTIAVTKGYKDNRDPAHRPKHYQALKRHLIERYKAVVVNGYEADDAIANKAYDSGQGDVVIVSNDKDLDQIPGVHYDWVTQTEYFIKYLDSKRVLYTQLLSGDRTDNIPGILSDAKAAKIISERDTVEDMRTICCEVYKEKYGDEWIDRMYEVERLVTLGIPNAN